MNNMHNKPELIELINNASCELQEHVGVEDKTREPDKQHSVANNEAAQIIVRTAPPGQPLSGRDTLNDTLADSEAPESAHRKRETGSKEWKPNRRHDPGSAPDTRSNSGRAAKRPSHRSHPYDRSFKDDDHQDAAPVLHGIYDAYISAVKDFGAFARLHRRRGKIGGLIHVSRLADGYTRHPSDVVKHGQAVKVKVIAIEGTRIKLSMKEVNQDTGYESTAQASPATGANSDALGRGRETRGRGDGGFQPAEANRNRKRPSPSEQWEICQLKASGVVKASDYLDLQDDDTAATGANANTMMLDKQVNIEIRDEQPPFLVGQTDRSLELSPIPIIDAPGGSMSRAALSGSALARERKGLQSHRSKENQGGKQDSRQRRSDPSNIRMPATASISQPKRSGTADQKHGKRTDLTIRGQRESLPVFALRDQLIEAVRQHSILIVVGETGSGKTTQLTQYLAEAGFTDNGIIGCTQPRRLAAASVAGRVAEEFGCPLGQEVGFSIRFEDRTSPETKIKYMTDGMLQREVLLDPSLQKYSVIMLDEAHERTVATDVLFALLKKIVRRRSDLKMLISSATLNAEKFSSFFNDAPIFTIPGRSFAVELMYSKGPEPDYLDAALVTVLEVHLTEPAGDILLFLTGQEEIEMACEILQERVKALGPAVPSLLVLPVHSTQPADMQSSIFEPAPPGSRKVVVATNIAETSVTIDDIRYVVDPGFVKQKAYNPDLGMDSLILSPVSQAQANQRAGRAGRTGPGKCFRLYTEAAYHHEMVPSPLPGIQRQSLSATILILKAMGIDDILHFDFMDRPAVNTTLTALKELYALGALDGQGLLTRLGRRMATFPLEPQLAKVLIAAADLGCSDEMVSIIAMLSAPSIFDRSKETRDQADEKKAAFHDPSGDHLTMLNVYNAWQQSGYSKAWCRENFIHAQFMSRALDVRKQLVQILERQHHRVVSCGSQTDRVRRALCTGFFRNVARMEGSDDGPRVVKTLLSNTPVWVHPSSALLGGHAGWVIYHELVLTSREYMRWTTRVEPQWLVEGAPKFLKISDATAKHRDQRGIKPLLKKHESDNDWRLSRQRRGDGHGGHGGRTWG